MFKEIEIHNWRQFENVNIKFHDRLTVLTGANATGKTTILNILNLHFGWNIKHVSTPRMDRSKGFIKYFSDLWKNIVESQATTTTEGVIGKIYYSDGKHSEIVLPTEVASTYNVQLRNQIRIDGLFVPSHRPIYKYHPVNQIPTRLGKPVDFYRTYTDMMKSNYIQENTQTRSPTYFIKEALISLATFGYGNEAVEANQDAIITFEEFQKILHTVLPSSLGFQRISIRVPEVVLVTNTGEFSLDAVSGGISAIIDLSWQIFLYSNDYDEFVVIIDEPENHLHPELQRTLFPKFLHAFPKLQFIVATHNPFIVSSVPESTVYVLYYNEGNKVVSTTIDNINKAGTSNEILRDALGLQTTLPVWVEKKLSTIIENYSQTEMNEENFKSLREQLESLGLGKYVPETISRLIDKSGDDKAQ